MDKLFFLNNPLPSAEPYTTSEIIEMKRLRRLGVIEFNIRKPPKGSADARPIKKYQLNERQARKVSALLHVNAAYPLIKLAIAAHPSLGAPP